MAKGDEGLARAGIAKQVDIEDQIPVLQRSLHEAIDRGKELEGYIAALLAKKREMESALQDFIAARAAAAAPTGMSSSSSATQSKAERAGCRLRPRACRVKPASPARRPRSIRTRRSCASCRNWRARTGSTSALPH